MSLHNRILVIGLDAATFDIITPLAKKGKLPTFSKIINNGYHAPLDSVIPVLSSAAWSTFMTGTNPGKHGIYDFVRTDERNYKLVPVTRLDIKYPSMWKLMSDAGKKVIVINVPMTYPAEKVNGLMITGLYTPDHQSFAYPLEYNSKLLEKGYLLNRTIFNPQENLDFYLEETYQRLEKNTNIILDILREEVWDFATVVYRETDEIPHGFWHFTDPMHPKFVPSKYRNSIEDLYIRMDEIMSRYLDLAGNSTDIIVVSDHGTGPLYKFVFLNEWLRQEGLLYIKDNISPLREIGITRQAFSSLLRKYGLVKLEVFLKKHLGDMIELIPKYNWIDFHSGIDWKRTKAYSYGWQGQIFINLKGREPLGIVEPGNEYQQLMQHIISKLRTLIDPIDQLPIVDECYIAKEIYHGDNMRYAPDILVNMRGLSYITKLGHELANETNKILSSDKMDITGSHRKQGIFIAYGPNIHSNSASRKIWIGDIAPTVLSMMDLPIPTWMDGKVIEACMPKDRRNRHIYTDKMLFDNYNETEQGLTHQQQDELMKRLTDLGYIN